MTHVAQMLTQEPIYKPSSIFCFKPILHSARKLILLIYGDNTCPLVLAMIIPKPLRRFIFPLMFIKNPLQLPKKTQHLCNWLLVERETADPSSIFYYLISSRIGSLHGKLIFLPKPSSTENPNLQPVAMAISSSSGSNS